MPGTINQISVVLLFFSGKLQTHERGSRWTDELVWRNILNQFQYVFDANAQQNKSKNNRSKDDVKIRCARNSIKNIGSNTIVQLDHHKFMFCL